MDEQWTLSELVREVGVRLDALATPKNGQIRAVPDDRTIRYYGTIGLIDRPLAMRGRTALYGRTHLAQVVAIKRLQAIGRSLAEIQTLWPTVDEATLSRMSGIELAASARRAKTPARPEFWKAAPVPALGPDPADDRTRPVRSAAVELRVELAPGVVLTLVVDDDNVSISPADVRAIRAAAAPLVAELDHRRLTPHARGETL